MNHAFRLLSLSVIEADEYKELASLYHCVPGTELCMSMDLAPFWSFLHYQPA